MTISKLQYKNSSSRPIIMTLEPWADTYTIAPAQTVDIVIEDLGGESDHLVEIRSVDRGHVYVYATRQQMIWLVADGVDLEPSNDNPDDF